DRGGARSSAARGPDRPLGGSVGWSWRVHPLLHTRRRLRGPARRRPARRCWGARAPRRAPAPCPPRRARRAAGGTAGRRSGRGLRLPAVAAGRDASRRARRPAGDRPLCRRARNPLRRALRRSHTPRSRLLRPARRRRSARLRACTRLAGREHSAHAARVRAAPPRRRL
ncbi:MAG: hypothetical protein AVDCRST_MAG45-1815, partial [uncultured Solirubrobacterales bacterium]